MKRSRQAIKIKLLDQTLVAGVGNIYASEALFRARLSPRLAANRLTFAQVKSLWRAIRDVLAEAIAGGSTVPLNFAARANRTGFFILAARPARRIFTRNDCGFMTAPESLVRTAAGPIKRIVQAARSTFYCPHCQKCVMNRFDAAGGGL